MVKLAGNFTIASSIEALGEASAFARKQGVRPEDLESTIYSAMGIDWTTIRYDDPFKRGFEYVPFGSVGTYSPVHDLWS